MRIKTYTKTQAAPPVRRYSMLELISCAEREVKLRKQVYPYRVSKGQMGQGTASAEIERMEAIALELRKLAGVGEGWTV